MTALVLMIWLQASSAAQFCAIPGPLDESLNPEGWSACVATETGPEACFPMQPHTSDFAPCNVPGQLSWAAVKVPVSVPEMRWLLAGGEVPVRARWCKTDGECTPWGERTRLTYADAPSLLYVVEWWRLAPR